MSEIFVNNDKITSFTFPGGECQIVVPAYEQKLISHQYMITAFINDSDGIMKLLLTTDALRRLDPKANISLVLPYIPYARQDRVCNPGEAHSLKVFANLINSQNFTQVIVCDPHSDVSEAVIDRIVIFNNHCIIDALLSHAKIKDFHLVSPDAGAAKKITSLAKFLADRRFEFDVVLGGKERDTKTGNITNFSVNVNDLGGKPCVIVDDICDGGGTFIGLAKVLKEANAGPLYLMVTHGIFSKGVEPLLEVFDYVFTTDTFISKDDLSKHKNVIVLEFVKYMSK